RGALAILAAISGAVAAGSVPGTAQAATAGGTVTVIVRGDGAGCESALADTLSTLGGRLTRPLGILDGGVATLPADRLAELSAAPCVAGVTLDSTLAPASIGGYDPTADVGSLYNTTLAVGAQQAWSQGYTGRGVGVAVIDTGVAPVQGLSASGQVINGVDVSFDSQSPALTYNDEYGHGTHIAGIIAGNDAYGTGKTGAQYAGDTSNFLGVAPDARIVNLKVGDENGVADVSQVIAAIDWVVQHRNDANTAIRVINLSYGTDSSQNYLLDPLAFATEVAW